MPPSSTLKTRHTAAAAVAVFAALAAPAVQANHAGTPLGTAPGVPQTVIIEGNYDNAVGSDDAASAGTITGEMFRNRPVQRTGEVLEFVPGVIVTQHSGDGKANQYFLRGFNLDHGTDFATRIAGMPVNMPSHGHGQGYSDINFLLPEIVQRIEYRKGPYDARSGDFGSAGAADILLLARLPAPFAQLTLGGHGLRRGVAGGSVDFEGGWSLLGAAELMRNDGPWQVPQGLRKRNGLLTLSGGSRTEGFSATLMDYHASWTATDQVPERLVASGAIDRYGSLDPTDGGDSARSSLSGEWHADRDGVRTRVSGYAMRYRLDLFSNFTYALERPATGDQFRQSDRRSVFGLEATRAFSHEVLGLPLRSEFGLGWRHDDIRVGLFDTAARTVIATTREDRIGLDAASAWAQSAVELSPSWRAVLGLRADHLQARVDSLTLAANSGTASDAQLSPRLSLIGGPFESLPKTEFFLNAGRGLHSNDARGMTARIDPRTGDPVQRVPGLVASRGLELGARTEAVPGLQASVALWQLEFDSELVYVGDAGATEASSASRRVGVEFGSRWAPAPWFLLDADLAFNRARFADGSRIPNAVDRVAAVAATLRRLGPWSTTLQWRYLGSGDLTEDGRWRSTPSSTFNLRASRLLAPTVELTLDVFNLFDRKVYDIQYVYASQVRGEAAPVEDRHVHPGEPRSLRLTLHARF